MTAPIRFITLPYDLVREACYGYAQPQAHALNAIRATVEEQAISPFTPQSPVLYVRRKDLNWAHEHKSEVTIGARYAPLMEYTTPLFLEGRQGLQAWQDGRDAMRNERDLHINNADKLRSELGQLVDAMNALKRSVHGFNEAQWERVHAAIASSEALLSKQVSTQ